MDDLLPVVKAVWRAHVASMLNREDGGHDASEVTDQDHRDIEGIDSDTMLTTLREYGDQEPRSSFCRLLDGEVKPETRRAIQSGFNRRESGPHVLIAQSQVGREGLNLHKACRRVFLFPLAA